MKKLFLISFAAVLVSTTGKVVDVFQLAGASPVSITLRSSVYLNWNS